MNDDIGIWIGIVLPIVIGVVTALVLALYGDQKKPVAQRPPSRKRTDY